MSNSDQSPYRGRFAPSPTGPLHFGSLIAAVGSYLQARKHNGAWLVRMDDLDRPRNVPGAADAILHTLEAYGLHWDETVMYQSNRDDAYHAALTRLDEQGRLYACGCSRREVADLAKAGIDAPVYPGTCRDGLPAHKTPRTLRVRCGAHTVEVQDRVQGTLRQDLPRQVGDFVLRRADGLVAYQLAVVVDDAEQGITEVVRGSDLLDSTPRQVFLQQLLGIDTPAYRHLPVAINAVGNKLSKQTRAEPLDDRDPVPALWRALAFLGQQPPAALQRASRDELLAWALAHWDPARIPAKREILP